MARKYQDYVIADGKLIGDFDGVYRDFEDPWHQSRADHVNDTRRMIALAQCTRLREQHPEAQLSRVIELGCGFGYLTDELRQRGFSAVGVDVADKAVRMAREKNPGSVFLTRAFSDPNLLDELDPDIVVMAEITWYVLDELDAFRKRLQSHASQRERPTYLIHLLSTYGPGLQTYGRDYFTNLPEILAYFNLEYQESGLIMSARSDDPLSQGTYFIGRVVP